jgi:hypothetical protein
MGNSAPIGGGGGLIRCQSDHDDYACSCGRVAMSGGDGTDSSTRVLVVRCEWLYPMLKRPLGVTAGGSGAC